MPAGVHGSGPGAPITESTEIGRVQSVDVFAGSHAQQDLFFVDALGQWQLHEERVHIGIRVETVDDRFNVGLVRGVRGQVLVEGSNADLLRTRRCFIAT